MSKSGQSNFLGVNNQAFAALSLFLQYVERSDFVEIVYEADNLEDFTIILNSRKRIICESKVRTADLSIRNVKDIIDIVLEHGEIAKEDELLIITNKADDTVKSVINNLIFYTDESKDELKKKYGLEEKHFEFIPQVKLWEVGIFGDDENRKGILLLMSKALTSDSPFWIPTQMLKDWTYSILVENVYLKSQVGGNYTKDDFFNEIENRKIEHLKRNGSVYEKLKEVEPEKVEGIIKLVSSSTPSSKDICANAISELVTNPLLHHEALRRLSTRKDLILENWNELWTATARGVYLVELFDIFENNLSTIENQKYILFFVNKILDDYAINYFREDFVKKDIADLCIKLFNENDSLEINIFEIIKKLYDYKSSRFLYIKYDGDDTWEREEISSILKQIYEKTTNNRLREEIIQYVIKAFNLAADDGKYWHYTPPQIFNILLNYIKISPEERILWFSGIITEQYQKFYKRFSKKDIYKGWEHMGSGIAQSGSEYSIEDRSFIDEVIEPAIESITDEEIKWKFVFNKLVTTDDNDVSFEKPDFLNRACIKFLLQQYYQGKHSNDAFGILSAFIKSRKGIPWKPDMIYQELSKSNITAKKKWGLIKVSLDEYNQLPVNVFVDQMVADLACNEEDLEIQDEAIKIIKRWVSNEKYRNNRSLGSYDIVDSIFRLLNNPKTFLNGVDILKLHLNGKNFINKKDTYESWDVGKALALIIQNDLKIGLQILDEINKHSPLSKNQQLVLCRTLDDIPDDRSDLLIQVYENFIDSFLGKQSIEEIRLRIPVSHARELIVSYAEKLAKIDEYEKAYRIIKLFVDDSDPSPDGHDPDEDPKNEYNKHKLIEEGKDNLSIDTVKGRCAWALRHFALLGSQDYVDNAFILVEKLAHDSNNYIRLQATYPLIEFAANRHSYLPNTEPKERFMKTDTALKVEELFFSMVYDPKNQKLPAIMKGLVHAFGKMRSIDDVRAFKVLTTFLNTGFEEIIHDVTPLVLFFALFRKKAFDKWVWGKLLDFDNTKFKELLVKLLKNGSPDIKQSLAWEFWRLPDENQLDKSKYNQELLNESHKYLSLLTEGEYDHEVWEKIYHFIERYLDYEFEICFDLWKKCVTKELPFFIEKLKGKDTIREIYWWPFFYNGKILCAIYDKAGEEEFLKWMDFLVSYPVELYIANDLGDAVNKLKTLPKENKLVEQIFDKLIKRNPSLYDIKKEWEHS